MVGVRVVLWVSAAALFFGGILNVAELLFAEDLGAGESGFADTRGALRARVRRSAR